MKYHILNYIKIYAFIVTLLFIAYLVKGYEFGEAVNEALIWGLLTATIVKIARYFRAKRGQKCNICD